MKIKIRKLGREEIEKIEKEAEEAEKAVEAASALPARENEIEGPKEAETVEEIEKESLYENFIDFFDAAARHVRLPASVFEELKSFKRIIQVDVPVLLEREKGSGEGARALAKVFPAYRIQHNNTLGPYIGGVRIYQNVTLEELKGLAALTTIKNSFLGLPFGGAKGGIAAEPKKLTKLEIERLARGYVQKIIKFLSGVGNEQDIITADVGCSSTLIGYMYDEYKKVTNTKEAKTAFTGKPLNYDGIKDREEVAALGGVYVLEALLKRREIESYGVPVSAEELLKEKKPMLKIAVQGFDDLGFNAACLLHDAGHKIIAISDSKGGIASVKGLEPREIAKWKRVHGTLQGIKGVLNITNEQLLRLKTDVLVLSALENQASQVAGQITARNAHAIKANIILELVDFGVSKKANEILFGQGKVVLPDVLANSGSIFADHLERIQNLEERIMSREEIEMQLKEKMQKSFDEVYEKARLLRVSMKEAAYVLALERLGKAIMKK